VSRLRELARTGGVLGSERARLSALAPDLAVLLADTKDALAAYDAWGSRMPDAGFTDLSPRWGWWHERPYAPARALLARIEELEGKA
jgi:hypothetical protein